jgi:hypothetical protein
MVHRWIQQSDPGSLGTISSAGRKGSAKRSQRLVIVSVSQKSMR